MGWQKGVSGNPGGRPKVNWQVREEAKRHALRVFARVLAETENPDPKIALPACRDVLRLAGVSFDSEEMAEAVQAMARIEPTSARRELDRLLPRPAAPLN